MSGKLRSYGSTVKRIADANARSHQIKEIRKSGFKASLVDDPLRPSPDLARAIEISRREKKK
ncbi:MAG: hypothetical protein KKB37_00760 [Alphaproteobacteria bacterium]|nr:hypothetical protein [Alphaproteobacteria bacterium]